ncbi:MAG: hypothetical protein WCE54_10560 [Ignavibacteriaceae bacterium]
MGANQIFSNTTEIEKLLKGEQLSAKTKPIKYLIISTLPLYRLINQTKIPYRKFSTRDLLIIELDLNNQEECGEKLEPKKSEVSIQKSEEETQDETEPP